METLTMLFMLAAGETGAGEMLLALEVSVTLKLESYFITFVKKLLFNLLS